MNPYAPPIAQPSSPAGEGRRAAVPVPGLEGRVFVRERGIFARPGFIVDGALLRTTRGVLEVTDPAGQVHRLRIRGLTLDPCPRVEVDGTIIDVFPSLPVWVKALCCLPFGLIVTGGLLGAMVGVFATFGNFRIARSPLPRALAFVLAAALTLGVYGAIIAFGIWVRSLSHH